MSMAEEKDSGIELAIGDHIRLKTRASNHHGTYNIEASQVAYSREPADGLILSIRDVHSGQLVAKTTGDLLQYVIEMVFDNTFSSKYASTKNAPRSADRVTATPLWRIIRTTLRDIATKGELLSTATPNFFTEGPLAMKLDGWKVIKVYSTEVTSLE
jgi:hypothetical protein